MKKMLKIVGIIILVFILLVILLFIKAALTPMVPNDYTDSTEANGTLEEKYLAMGKYQKNME